MYSDYSSAPLPAWQGRLQYLAGMELGLEVFVVIYLVLVIQLIMYYAWRNYVILDLLLFTLLIIVIWVLPGNSDKVNKWRSKLTLLTIRVPYSTIHGASDIGKGEMTSLPPNQELKLYSCNNWKEKDERNRFDN